MSAAENDRISARSVRRWRLVVAVLLVVVTVLATVGVSTRLQLDPNVASLLPERGEAAALRRYVRAYGGTDLGVVLVRDRCALRQPEAQAAADPDEPADAADRPAEAAGECAGAEEVKAVAEGLTGALAKLATVQLAASGITVRGELDPLLAWRHADAGARRRLAQALTPEGMRQRLRGTRALLLAPGGGAATEKLAQDPLRLVQLLAEGKRVGAGVSAQADGSFASDDGLVRLVLVRPKGQALRGYDAKAFVDEAQQVLERYRQEHPKVELGLTGGHAIAAATEHMLIADMTVSGTVSLLLASLAFLLTFRRLRALGAVMPPVVLGTLWTAAIAALLPSGLSAIAVAFMSVVVGVGVDTGVHVYAALLEARALGLAPAEAARTARRKTQKPVLVAAVTAGAAFAALGLSEIGAVRQLGILCAGGEVLTALAIVVITPEIGAWLERRPPPPYRAPRWTGIAAALTATRTRAALLAAVALLPVVAVIAGYRPELSDAIIAMRPKKLEPLQVQQEVYDTFGGRPGQWVVMIADADREAARARADQVAERLSALTADVESVDALLSLAPAPATQRQRFAERDALGLPGKADQLKEALEDVGFNPSRFEPVFESLRAPKTELLELSALENTSAAIMLSRFLGHDGSEHTVVLYVLPRPDEAAQRRVREAVKAVDPAATITGYSLLETSLKASLQRDLPRIGLVAGALVLLALGLSLRRPRDVILAALVVIAEIGVVLALIRLLEVPLHAYDALVLPVLLGITVDEGMFLLYRARDVGGEDIITETLQLEGPPVATTALTTAAGFAGLVLCDFDGLRHLGLVGALGSLVGLLVALVIVPAGLRLTMKPKAG